MQVYQEPICEIVSCSWRSCCLDNLSVVKSFETALSLVVGFLASIIHRSSDKKLQFKADIDFKIDNDMIKYIEFI